MVSMLIAVLLVVRLPVLVMPPVKVLMLPAPIASAAAVIVPVLTRSPAKLVMMAAAMLPRPEIVPLLEMPPGSSEPR